MDVKLAKTIVQDNGFKVVSEKRLGNNTGTQIKLASGQNVNVYDKGTFLVQGKDSEKIKQLLSAKNGGTSGAAGGTPKEVFVVYGHDDKARAELEAMLRRWGLEPLILDQLPSEGQTVIEKLEAVSSHANFAVVLATPDDEGHRAGHADEKAYRARQNVVLELGMLLAKLGRRNIAILLKQQDKMERPSDINGLIYIPFKDNLEKEAGLLLAKEMAQQGYNIDLKKI